MRGYAWLGMQYTHLTEDGSILPVFTSTDLPSCNMHFLELYLRPSSRCESQAVTQGSFQGSAEGLLVKHHFALCAA